MHCYLMCAQVSLITDPQGSWISLDVTLRAPKAGMAPVSPKSTSSCFAAIQAAVLCLELLLARGDEALPAQMLLFQHLPGCKREGWVGSCRTAVGDQQCQCQAVQTALQDAQ